MPNYPAQVGPYQCGRGERLTVIAGPCVIENRDLTLEIAEELENICRDLNVQLIFKASFDKANRTSVASYRGPGLDEGLSVLAQVREQVAIPVTTDIHETDQAAAVGQVCELLQIPAFLARQTDLLTAAGVTGRAVHVKKAQFLSPHDMGHVVRKLTASGCENILLGERGSFFGYGRLVNDMRAIPQMRQLGVPVVFDATHSVQEPGGLGATTGGNREMVEPLACAAAAIGIDALFMETHPDPENALSDGPNMVRLQDVSVLLSRVIQVRDLVSTWEGGGE